MNYEEFDYILNVEPEASVQEASYYDPRTMNRKLQSVDFNPDGIYVGVRDPKMMTSWNFGKQLQREIGNMGTGYSCQVLDCGGEVAVTVSHNQSDTGRTACKTFIIVFGRNGDGIIKSSTTRWRSISGVSQAASYIRSVASNLTSYTNQAG